MKTPLPAALRIFDPLGSEAAEVKVPKYLQLAGYFRERIRLQELVPGDRLPTFLEMRRDYGATTATVERMLVQLEREGLVERRPQSGIYVLEQSRESLAVSSSPKSIVIGCMFPEDESGGSLSYWVRLLSGFRAAAHAAGADLLLLHSDTTVGWEKIDGVLAHEGPVGGAVRSRAESYGVPFVETMNPETELDSVFVDNAGGIRSLVEHLLSQGHRRIGFLLFTEFETMVSRLRLTAYRDALERAGIEPRPEWVCNLPQGHDFLERGARGMEEWLESGWTELGCTALLVQNDRSAIGAMEVMRQQGIRVPQDVSVVGFDSTDEASFCVPRLTSIGVPLRDIAFRAVELLLNRIQNPESASVRIMFPVQLDIRESTCPPL